MVEWKLHSRRLQHISKERRRDTKCKTTDLGALTWGVSERHQLLRIGASDRTAYGFKVGGEPRAYGLTENCPVDLT